METEQLTLTEPNPIAVGTTCVSLCILHYPSKSIQQSSKHHLKNPIEKPENHPRLGLSWTARPSSAQLGPAPGLAGVSKSPALPDVHSAAKTAVAAAGTPWRGQGVTLKVAELAAEGGCEDNNLLIKMGNAT